jgi:hypothetical protein
MTNFIFADIHFDLVQRGAIEVNSANFLHLSDQAFVLSLDCAQKYPEAAVSAGETISIILYVGTRTLHVNEHVPRSNDGNYIDTILEVHGFDSGRWHVAIEDGKWGPMVYGIRRVEQDKSWPVYEELA